MKQDASPSSEGRALHTWVWRISTVTALTLLVGVVNAQTTAPTEGATPAADDDRTLDVVVVTARKKEENLQVTPVSITAYTAADIEARQADNLSQISDSTPNFSFESTAPISGSNAAASAYIRGVGQYDFTLVSDPGVGVYLDGVYIARSVGGVLDLLDVERIEVLRGPQGTLFGKNTIGGAINVTSRRPGSAGDGYVELRTGTDERFDVKASWSGPLSESVGFLASIGDFNQDGYVTNLGGGPNLSDTNATVARLALDFHLSDSFSAFLAFDGTRRREQGRAQKLLAFNPMAPVPSFGAFPPVAAFLGVPDYDNRYLAGGPFATHQGVESAVKSDLDLWGGALTLQYDFGGVSLKSITGYRRFDAEFGRDSDNAPFPYDIVNTIDLMDHKQVSEELQLGTGADERFSWLVGLFYFQEEGSNRNDVLIPPITIKSGGAVDNESAAAFGQGTLKFTDRFSGTLGVRYTEDTKRFIPDQQVLYNEFTVPVFNGAGIPEGTRILPVREFEREFSDTNMSAALNFQWTDGFMTYVSYAEGFKSGGFDQRVFPPRGPDGRPASFEPETLNQYEAGWKWENSGRTARLNGALFYSEYEDIQVRVLDQVAPGVGNAAAGEVKGGELELTVLPVTGLLLEAGAGYLDTEITELGPNIDPNADRIRVGNRFINSPEWQYSASVSYTAEVGDSADLTFRVDWSAKDKVFNNWANDESIAQGAYSLVNAAITLDFGRSGWRFMVAGKNLTDETYIVTGNDEIDSFGYTEAIYARPLEWSLSVKKSF